MKEKMKKFGAWLLAAALVFAGAGAAQAETIKVADQAALEAELVKVNVGGSAEFELAAGEFTTYGTSIAQGKKLTLIGALGDNGELLTKWKYGADKHLDGEHGSDYSFGNTDVTFRNLELVDNYTDTSYYRGFVRATPSLRFENCTIRNMMGYLGSGDVVFKDCTFDVADVCEYCIKTYSGSSFVFDGCTFKSNNKGFVQVYCEKVDAVRKVTVKNCTFIAGAGTSKSAIYFYDYSYGQGATWDIDFVGKNVITEGHKLWGDMKIGTGAKTSISINGVAVWENGANVVTVEDVEPVVASAAEFDVAPADGETEIGAGDVAAVEAVMANTAVGKVETGIDVATAGVSADKKYVSVVLTSASVSKADSLAKVVSMTFEVTPCAVKVAEGSKSVEVIPNSEITAPITFRFPVDAAVEVGTKADVTHNGVAMTGDFAVAGDDTAKYIEVASETFSTFAYTLKEGGEEPPEGVTLALSGSGTADAPYRIENCADMQNFRDWVNAGNTGSGMYFELTADIDLSGETNWTPIGTFAGTFDGKGKTIANLTIAIERDVNIGFFNTLEAGSVVKNLNFAGAKVSGKNVGILCGLGNAGATVQDIRIDSTCSVTATKYAGGVAMEFYGTLSRIANHAPVTTTGDRPAAGIVAWTESPAQILYCTNTAKIVAGGWGAGGITANATGSRIEGCVNVGDVSTLDESGEAPAGGIACRSSGATVSHCLNLGNVSTRSSNANSTAGGILGLVSGGNGSVSYCENRGNVSAERREASGIASSLYGTTISYCLNAGEVSSPACSAAGVSAKPAYGTSSCSKCVNAGLVTGASADNTYELSQSPSDSYYYSGDALLKSDGTSTTSADALAILNGDTDKSFFKLGADGKLTSVLEYVPEQPMVKAVAKIGTVEYPTLQAAFAAVKGSETVELVDNVDLKGELWTPVVLNGNFDGKGFAISNLVINLPEQDGVGFFSQVSSGKTISNVNFVNVDVTGLCNVGAVVGKSCQGASNVTVTGTIKVRSEGYDSSTYARTGVICGGDAYGEYVDILVDGGDMDESYVIDHLRADSDKDGRYVAGMIGHASGVTRLEDCTVRNLEIDGKKFSAGLCGVGPMSALCKNCTVENVYLVGQESGAMFGWLANTDDCPAVENATISNVTFNSAGGCGTIGGYEVVQTVSRPTVVVKNATIVDVTPVKYNYQVYVTENGDNYHFANVETAIAAVGENLEALTATSDQIEIPVTHEFYTKGEGLWGIRVKAAPVVRVGTKEYATIAAALADSEGEVEMTLLANAETEIIKLRDNVNSAITSLTIDLNGFTLTAVSATAFEFQGTRSIVIKDAKGTGSFVHGFDDSSSCLINMYSDNAFITFEAGTFHLKEADYWYGLINTSSATRQAHVVIKGGTYDFDPSNLKTSWGGPYNYVPEGYESVQQDTTPKTWVVQEKADPVTICVSSEGGDDDGDGTAEKPFATLAKAVATAHSGDTVKLLTDLTGDFALGEAKDLSFDLGDKTLTGSVTVSAGSLVLSGAGTITGTVTGATVAEGFLMSKYQQDNTATSTEWDYTTPVIRVLAQDDVAVRVTGEGKEEVYYFKSLGEASRSYVRGGQPYVENESKVITITMLKDNHGGGLAFKQKDTTVTVDFGGFTYTVDSDQLAGSDGTTTQAAQILKRITMTFKNGTLVADHPQIKDMIRSYAKNMTFDNMVIDGAKMTNPRLTVACLNGEMHLKNGTKVLAAANTPALTASYYILNATEYRAGLLYIDDNKVEINGSLTYERDDGITIAKMLETVKHIKSADYPFELVIPEECEWVDYTEGKKFLDYKKVAQITVDDVTTKYYTLEDAVAAAGDNDVTIVVIGDTSKLTPPEGWEFKTEGGVTKLVKKAAYVAEIFVNGESKGKYETLQAAMVAAGDYPGTAESPTIVQLAAGVVQEGNLSIAGNPLSFVTFQGADDLASSFKDCEIGFQGSSDFKWVGVTFRGILWDNARIVFSTFKNEDLTFEGNKFVNLKPHATESTRAYVHFTAECKNFTYVNNVFAGADLSGTSIAAINSNGNGLTGNITITNNVIRDSLWRSLQLMFKSNDGVNDTFTITDNWFEGNAKGIQIVGSGDTSADTVIANINYNAIDDAVTTSSLTIYNTNLEKTTYNNSHNYFVRNPDADPGAFYANWGYCTADNIASFGVYPYYANYDKEALEAGTKTVREALYNLVVGDVAQVIKADGTPGEKYGSLRSAVDAADEGDTIRMLCDATEGEILEIGKSITIDLDGKKLTLGKADNRLADKRANVTIRNGELSIDKNVFGRNGWYDTAALVYGTLTLDAVTMDIEDYTVSNIFQILGSGDDADISTPCDSVLNVVGCVFSIRSVAKDYPEAELPNGGPKPQNTFYGYCINGGTATMNVKDSMIAVSSGYSVQAIDVTLDNSSLSSSNMRNIVWQNAGATLVNGSTLFIDGGASHGFTNGKLLVNAGCTVDVKNISYLGLNTANGSLLKAGSIVRAANCCTTDTLESYKGKDIAIRANGKLTIEAGADVICDGVATTVDGASLDIAGGCFKKVAAGGTGTISLTGGVYVSEPDHGYAAEGYEVQANVEPFTKDDYPWAVAKKAFVPVDEKPITIDITQAGGTQAIVPVTVSEDAVVAMVNAGIVTPTGDQGTVKAEDVSAGLAKSQANDQTVWQNYVMGVDGTDEKNALATIGEKRADKPEEVVVVKTPIAEFNPPQNTGVTVTYNLLKKGPSETKFTVYQEGLLKPEVDVNTIELELGDTLWKFEAVFSAAKPQEK